MSEKRIKVTDRRMFTPDGELREEFRDLEAAESSPERAPVAPPPENSPGEAATGAPEAGATSPPERPVEAVPAGPRPDPSPGPPPGGPTTGARMPRPTFFDLVGVLAEPVALYLGDAQLPDGESAQNLEMARLHIDLLDVLKTKTESNLSTQESQILVDLIYRLRLRYVQKSG